VARGARQDLELVLEIDVDVHQHIEDDMLMVSGLLR
jgi:hypothetical protein